MAINKTILRKTMREICLEIQPWLDKKGQKALYFEGKNVLVGENETYLGVYLTVPNTNTY